MKTKKFETKLTLNKKTISNLDSQQMNDLKGGIGEGATDDPLCSTFNKYCTQISCPMGACDATHIYC